MNTFDKSKTYWHGHGAHQAVYDKLREELVPNQGNAATEAGELLRVMGNVYYDVYNNGGGNLASMGRASDRRKLVYLLGEHKYNGLQRFERALAPFIDEDDREAWSEAVAGDEAFDKLAPILEDVADFCVSEAQVTVLSKPKLAEILTG